MAAAPQQPNVQKSKPLRIQPFGRDSEDYRKGQIAKICNDLRSRKNGISPTRVNSLSHYDKKLAFILKNNAISVDFNPACGKMFLLPLEGAANGTLVLTSLKT